MGLALPPFKATQLLSSMHSGPEFLGSQDRNNLKLNQIIPAVGPGVQGLRVGSLHQLEAAHFFGIDPTHDVADALGQHAAHALESFANGFGVAAFECLYGHEEHGRECIESLPRGGSARKVYSCASASELQFEAELDLPRSGRSVISTHLRHGLAEAINIGGAIVGLAELHAIEEIVGLRAEL